jgi:hypothetical protein
MAIPQEFTQFMPVGPVPTARPPAKPPAKPGAKAPVKPATKTPPPPADPEQTPERQRARRLGSYGADLLRDAIKADYAKQVGKWRKHITVVTNAFSTALGQQVSTMKKEEARQRAKAELALFLFSLVTAGVMRWAGTFIQYKIYPKMMQAPTSKVTSIEKLPEGYRFTKVMEMDYNKQMAAFAGGLTSDIGNISLRYVKQRQQNDPFAALAPDDTGSLVRLTEQALTDALDDGTSVVLDDIQKAIVWMEQSSDFGDGWAAFTNNNETLARIQIRERLEQVRGGWAKQWPVFGTDPKPINQSLLSQSFERALWSAFIDKFYTDGFISLGKWQGVGPFSYDDVMSKRMDKNQNYFSRMFGLGDDIVNRLKYLNIVRAETDLGLIQQVRRITDENAPNPAAEVDDEVDSYDEVREVWKWARKYPGDIDQQVKFAGAEGVPRALPVIPSYGQ